MKNVTPDRITSLAPNEVFVFGSNRAGRHGRGAAKTALKWGAVHGKGEGLMGQTYGLPTKGRRIEVLTLREIGYAVDRFVQFAISRPDLHFLVTEVGCGLAGYRPKQIAPLFRNALGLGCPGNVSLPSSFHKVIYPTVPSTQSPS